MGGAWRVGEPGRRRAAQRPPSARAAIAPPFTGSPRQQASARSRGSGNPGWLSSLPLPLHMPAVVPDERLAVRRLALLHSLGDGCRIERFRIEHRSIPSGAVVEGVGWLGDSLMGRNAAVRWDAANRCIGERWRSREWPPGIMGPGKLLVGNWPG